MMEQRQATAHTHNHTQRFGWQAAPIHDALHTTFITSLASTPYDGVANLSSTISHHNGLNSPKAERLTAHICEPVVFSSLDAASNPNYRLNHAASAHPFANAPVFKTSGIMVKQGASTVITAPDQASRSQALTPPAMEPNELHARQCANQKLHRAGNSQLDKPLHQLQRMLLCFIALSLLLCLFAPHAKASAQVSQNAQGFTTGQPTLSEPPAPHLSDQLRQQGHCQQEVCWQVSPVLCPSNDTDSSCQLQLSVRWTSTAPISPCLHLDRQQLHCWASAIFGHSQHQLHLSQHAHVTLSDANGLMLEQQIAVLQRQPKQRARLMMPWSIF